jgi:ketosteroid isomerase-like protein
MQAWLAQDRATLEDCLAPDYALIVSAMPGQRVDRALWLETCDRYICTAFRYRDVQVRDLGGGIAIMSSIADQQARIGDVDRSGCFFLTDVWRLEADGQWRIAVRYSSHPEAAGTSSAALNG